MLRRSLPGRVGRRPNDAAGFSILEALVVVFVLGIAMAIGIPGLISQMGKIRLESSATDVANLMRQTRLRAIRDNVNYTVQVSGSEVHGMGAFGSDPLELEFENPVAVGDGPAVCLDKYDGSGDTFDAGSVVYQGTGIATGTGAICIHDGKGNVLQVVVEFPTAQPKIRKYLPAAVAPAGEGFYEKTGFNTAAGTGNVWVWF